MTGGLEPVSCVGCGRQVVEPPLTWTAQRDRRGATWLCDSCTRRSLRLLEAGLDETWA